jgi:hypothetical protein
MLVVIGLIQLGERGGGLWILFFGLMACTDEPLTVGEWNLVWR